MSNWDKIHRNSGKTGHFAGITVEDQDAYFLFFGGGAELEKSPMRKALVDLRAAIHHTWMEWHLGEAALRRKNTQMPKSNYSAPGYDGQDL